MAPKRQRKVGMKRIDAAIDALAPCGFTKKTICSTIKKLLKVYDDAAAWHVIEEDAYRLVIETILDDEEQKEKENQKEKDNVETRVSEAAGAETNNALEDNMMDQGESSSAAREALLLPSVESGCGQNLLDSSPSWEHSQPDQLTSSTPRRPPCYGWLSETESDCEDEDRPLQLAIEVCPPLKRVRKRPVGWDVKPSDL